MASKKVESIAPKTYLCSHFILCQELVVESYPNQLTKPWHIKQVFACYLALNLAYRLS